MRELRPGLWHWKAPHPQWQPTEPWNQNASSYAIDDGERLLLFDPLSVPPEIEQLAVDRETAIVLTAPWHERDAPSLVERLGVPVYTPLPDAAEDVLRTYGVTLDHGWISPDVQWLLDGEASQAHWYSDGDICPSESRRSPDRSATTWCSGSRAIVRSSPATRSPTSAKALRSTPAGFAQA